MRDMEKGRDTGRGRSRLPAGTPMRDLIPGLGSHLELKVGVQPLSHPGIPTNRNLNKHFFKKKILNT